MNESNNEKMLGQVTTEMLYDFLRDFKADMDRRFEVIEKRMDRIEDRFEKRFEQIEYRLDKIEAKLEEVYESRESMKVRLTTKWAFMSLFIAMLSSTVVLAFGRAF